MNTHGQFPKLALFLTQSNPKTQRRNQTFQNVHTHTQSWSPNKKHQNSQSSRIHLYISPSTSIHIMNPIHDDSNLVVHEAEQKNRHRHRHAERQKGKKERKQGSSSTDIIWHEPVIVAVIWEESIGRILGLHCHCYFLLLWWSAHSLNLHFLKLTLSPTDDDDDDALCRDRQSPTNQF